jgi:hypothetical protein
MRGPGSVTRSRQVAARRGRRRQACAVCGGPASGRPLRLYGRLVCGVCEGITVRLLPDHPLYPTWLSLVRGIVPIGR